ncbi:2Fe-2S iron-sulfur cluster-binding protein [Georgenia sp. SYP-B2076]|uniref:2Fe-2S iron-sulfur cluster-binding protein n=1 Tax=Georgenia sp. SYP-B2076 TaxID=2495881 RepID=UPI000F8F3A2C|nr:2Fe-2S iron-sulfur cluster-binding protein [Georgenia sp. SYP-B2076]
MKITYTTADGVPQPVETEPGMSLMEAAVLNGVDGIVAECGGGCSCATCHVYLDQGWCDTFDEPAPEESSLLEFLDGVEPNSRLSCQLLLRPDHDGLCVRTPASQG